MKKLMIVMIGLNLFLEAGFYRNDNTNIVSDTKTSLQWQDNINIQYAWNDAIDYCRDLTLGGHSDWRLPNINELLTLVDYTKSNPTITNIFAYRTSNRYWSSTTYAASTSNAWSVYFSSGGLNTNDKSISGHVRCVRAG